MSGLWDQMPVWAQYLTQGLGLFTLMAFAAVIVTRIGRNPYWGLLSVVPFVPVVGIWLLAILPWPSLKNRPS